MSDFDFSTLITDRTSADVSALSALLSKKMETWTPEELEKFNNGLLKGGYWWTDLNRVTACMEYINRELQVLGYETGYKPVLIERPDIPGESRLPDGYTELEYIESTGEQYINTNILANQDSKISAKIAFLGESGENILGARNTSTDVTNRFGLITFGSTGKIGCFFGNSSTQTIHIDSNTHEYELSKSGISVDGTVYSFSASNFSTSYPAVLFGFNNGENGVVKTKSRVWYFEMDGIKLIPCKDKYSEVGMYDIKNKNFIKNSGLGFFLPGEEVLPTQKPNPLDPYTWYKEDCPKIEQMDAYLENVRRMRGVFSKTPGIPTTPETMRRLTTVEANNIEKILETVETVIQRIKHTVSLGWALGVADIGLYGGI